MKTSLFAVLLVIATASNAKAQTITVAGNQGSNLPEAYSVRLPIRVVESFSVPVSSDSGNSEQAIEAARRQLYRTMQDECSALSESFKAECRIASFNVTLGRTFAPPGPAGTAPVPPLLRSVDASVSYGLRVKD